MEQDYLADGGHREHKYLTDGKHIVISGCDIRLPDEWYYGLEADVCYFLNSVGIFFTEEELSQIFDEVYAYMEDDWKLDN